MSSMSSLVSPGMTYILLPPFPDNPFEMMCSKVMKEEERERESERKIGKKEKRGGKKEERNEINLDSKMAARLLASRCSKAHG